jgi:hypothetical protein
MSALYGLFKQSMLSLSPSVDFDNTSELVKAALVTSNYSANTATNGHQYFSSVGTNALATATLTSRTVVGGVFDAADVTFSSVSGSGSINQIIIYKDTGTASNSPLIAVIDSTSSGNIAITPNGGDITVSWDNGASKIFAL